MKRTAADVREPSNFFRTNLLCVTNLRITGKHASLAESQEHSTLASRNRAISLRGGSPSVMVIGLLFALTAFSAGQSQMETFTIDRMERQAIVYSNQKPAPSAGAPVAFVFHGHGGTATDPNRPYRTNTLAVTLH